MPRGAAEDLIGVVVAHLRHRLEEGLHLRVLEVVRAGRGPLLGQRLGEAGDPQRGDRELLHQDRDGLPRLLVLAQRLVHAGEHRVSPPSHLLLCVSRRWLSVEHQEPRLVDPEQRGATRAKGHGLRHGAFAGGRGPGQLHRRVADLVDLRVAVLRPAGVVVGAPHDRLSIDATAERGEVGDRPHLVGIERAGERLAPVVDPEEDAATAIGALVAEGGVDGLLHLELTGPLLHRLD